MFKRTSFSGAVGSLEYGVAAVLPETGAPKMGRATDDNTVGGKFSVRVDIMVQRLALWVGVPTIMVLVVVLWGPVLNVWVLVGMVTVFAALMPLGFVLWFLWWFEGWNPLGLVGKLVGFLWGGVVAIGGVLLIQGELIYSLFPDMSPFVNAAVVTPFLEEFLKAVVLLFVLYWFRARFVSMGKIVVVGVLSAAGFAFVENIFYIFPILGEVVIGVSGVEAFIEVWVLRGVFSFFVHIMFVFPFLLIVGLGFVQRWRVSKLVGLGLVGYLFGVGLHSLWNGSAMLMVGDNANEGWWVTYFWVMVPIFVGCVVGGGFFRKHEIGRVQETVGALVEGGWLPESRIKFLGSWGGRVALLKDARWGRYGFGVGEVLKVFWVLDVLTQKTSSTSHPKVGVEELVSELVVADSGVNFLRKM